MVRNRRNFNFISTDKPMLGCFPISDTMLQSFQK